MGGRQKKGRINRRKVEGIGVEWVEGVRWKEGMRSIRICATNIFTLSSQRSFAMVAAAMSLTLNEQQIYSRNQATP